MNENYAEKKQLSEFFGPGVLPAVRMVEPEINEQFLLNILLAAVPALQPSDAIPDFLKVQAE